MWYYAAAAGWLALCGMAYAVYKKASWKDVTFAVAMVLFAALCTAVVMGLVIGSAFLFVYIPQMLFGDVGGGVGGAIWLCLILFVLLSEDPFRERVKAATVFVAVVVPLIILLFKAG